MAITAASVTSTSPTEFCLFPVSLRGSRPSNRLIPLSENLNFGPRCKISPLIVRRMQVTAMSTTATGSLKEGQDASSSSSVGRNDLLIVGPGVLGRLVAERWREEYPECQIFGQTATADHHDELLKIGINPALKGTLGDQKFPSVIYCAPPSRTPDYPCDVRDATLSWSGEGSFLFTSSSAPYDRSDNGPCHEDSPIVPIGRSPKTDVLLKAERVVLDSGGCVVRLAGLYISLVALNVI